MKINYNLYMEEILKKIKKEEKVPRLLLHTCCAPCSSSVIKKLAEYFEITVFYYNPNIDTTEEYQKRKEEQIRFLKEIEGKCSVSFYDCDYEKEEFEKISKGLEKEKEGGGRCPKCFQLRLEKTAKTAKEQGFDYFGTSLTVSPYKNAEILNKIGESLSNKYQISFLYSDFKKKNGYKESIELSKKYQLYRQDYCGCIYSKQERELEKKSKA